MSKRPLSFLMAFSLCLALFGENAAERKNEVLTLSQAGGGGAAIKRFLEESKDRPATIKIPCGEYRPGSLTIPPNVALEFENGGRLSVAQDETLEINGAINAGRQQIFAGEGTVCGQPKISAVLPEWFGAGCGNGNDDSQALQKAIDFAGGKTVVNTALNRGERTLPVDLGSGVFQLQRGLKSNSFSKIEGHDAVLNPLPGFPEKDFALDISLMKGMPWNIACSLLVKGIQFGNFSNGIRIATNDADQSRILIEDCKFSCIGDQFYRNDLANPEYCSPDFPYGTAIFLDSQSSINVIAKCVFSACHRVLYVKRGDYVILESSWISTRPIVQGKNVKSLRYSPIVNKNGCLTLRDILGVPGNRGDAGNFKWWNPPVWKNGDCYPGHPSPTGDPSILWANQAENAWIANYCCLLCDNVRFGGEYGGFSAVNNFAGTDVGSWRFITISNSMICHEFNEPTIRLFAVPDMIALYENHHMNLYMRGKFSWEGKNYDYKLKLLEFANSLPETEIAKIAIPATTRIKLSNNAPIRQLGHADLRQQDMIPPQLWPNLLNGSTEVSR